MGTYGYLSFVLTPYKSDERAFSSELLMRSPKRLNMLPAKIKKERHTANMVAVFVFLLL